MWVGLSAQPIIIITKNELDKLVEKYETTDFIKDDPIQFPHRFKNKEDIELAGFIASLFAYGNRKIFIAKLNDLFNRADNNIADYIKNGEFKNLKGLEYRFSKDSDIIPIFEILYTLYKVAAWKNYLSMDGIILTQRKTVGIQRLII